MRSSKRRSGAPGTSRKSGRTGAREPARESLQRRVDRSSVSAVETSPAAVVPVVTQLSGTMEKEHFGTFLRRAREDRAILLSDVAQKTKLARTTLELMEKGDLAELPAAVYVRGFIRAFARAIGADESEPLALYDRAVESKNAAEKAKDSIPTTLAASFPLGHGAVEDESMAPRRGMGLAVFVIILLLIATITLSLLLRRPPQSGEGLSLVPSSPTAAFDRAALSA